MWCRNAAMPLNPERWNPASLVTAAAAAAAHSRRLKERQTPSCATKCAASSNCEDDPLSPHMPEELKSRRATEYDGERRSDVDRSRSSIHACLHARNHQCMCNDSQKFFAKSCTTKLAVYACSKLTSSYVYQATHTVFQHNNINRRTAVAFARFSVGTDRRRQSVEITNARKPTDALQDRTSST